MNKYFNLCGLTFVIVILIPNIFFRLLAKVEILEQIGRFGYLSVCFSYFYFLIKASG